MKVVCATLVLGVLACAAPEPVAQPNIDFGAWKAAGSPLRPEATTLNRYVGCYRFEIPADLAPRHLPGGRVLVRLLPEPTSQVGTFTMNSHPRTIYRTEWTVRDGIAHLEWMEHDTGFQLFLDKRGPTPAAWAYTFRGTNPSTPTLAIDVVQVTCGTSAT